MLFRSKFEKCIEAAEKSIKSYTEFSSVAEQYALHIKHLWAKSLCQYGKYMQVIKLLIELIQQYKRVFDGSTFNNSIFNMEHLLMVKTDIGDCYLVFIYK